MAVFRYEWCRVEGNLIPDLGKEYGTFTQLPVDTKVFYGTPEIQIDNPTNVVNGCVYKVVPISEFGYTSILDIDDNYNDITKKINEYDKTVDVEDDSENSAQYYYEPFVVTESSVIFHADSTKKRFDHYAIVYVDQYATPDIVTIVAKYTGAAVPVGTAFEDKYLEVWAVYADGNRVQIKEGYNVEPDDKVITQLASNTIKITYTSPTGTTFITTAIIEGTKSLIGIEAFYDGPSIAYGQEALRKYFYVVAQYSDESTATVTDFSFPSGNVVSANNAGVITIYYKGFYANVVIPTYEVSSSRLIAYYDGPNVEVGNNFDTSYCKIKIYYQANDNVNAYYEDISPDRCTFSNKTVEHEGVNHVVVQYQGKTGIVSTTMIVTGIKPEAVLSFIEAQYTGAPVTKGKSFSVERVICKAHYTNGAIVIVKDFALNSNVIQYVGVNEFLVTYKDKDVIATTTLIVTGLEIDPTETTGYAPITLQNHYPEATRINNRYRGPAEAYKHNSISFMLWENIKTLYELYAKIEQDFNDLVDATHGNGNIRTKTMNVIYQIESESSARITDSRFTTGKYQSEKEESHE